MWQSISSFKSNIVLGFVCVCVCRTIIPIIWWAPKQSFNLNVCPLTKANQDNHCVQCSLLRNLCAHVCLFMNICWHECHYKHRPIHTIRVASLLYRSLNNKVGNVLNFWSPNFHFLSPNRFLQKLCSFANKSNFFRDLREWKLNGGPIFAKITSLLVVCCVVLWGS